MDARNGVSAPANGAEKPQWKIAWERFQVQYEQADDFVLAVRRGEKSLSDPSVIKGLLQRYGRFDMSHEGFAFGATMGVIDIMIAGSFEFGVCHKIIPESLFSAPFKAMHSASAGVMSLSDLLKARAVKAPVRKQVREIGSDASKPVPEPTPEEAESLVEPAMTDLELLVEAYLVENDDEELAVQMIQARARSASHVKLTREFIRTTIRRIMSRRAEEARQAEYEDRVRRRVEEGELPDDAFEEPAQSPRPISEPEVDEDDDEEEKDPDDEEGSEEEPEISGEQLLRRLSVKVPKTIKPSLVEEPGEEDDMSTGALDALRARVTAALRLIDLKSDVPQLAVFGVANGQPFPQYPFLQFFDITNGKVARGTALEGNFFAAVVLLEVMTADPACRTGMNQCMGKAENLSERVFSVPRIQLITLLAATAGMPVASETDDEEDDRPPQSTGEEAEEEEVEEEAEEEQEEETEEEETEEAGEAPPAPEEPTRPPAEPVSREPNAPRVQFKLLHKGEFPSDPTWNNKQFAAKQVGTLPHGLSPGEIGKELTRRAGLVGRKCTVASIQLAFAHHLEANPEDAKTLEMVTTKYNVRKGTYKVTTYVVPVRKKKPQAELPQADPPSEEHSPAEVVPEPVAAAATAVKTESSSPHGRRPESGDFFAEEIPKLPKGLDPNKWFSQISHLSNTPKVDTMVLRNRFYRWRTSNPGVVPSGPAGVDPATNGHVETSAPPQAPVEVVVAEPKVEPAPQAAAVIEESAPAPAPTRPSDEPTMREVLSEIKDALRHVTSSAVRAERTRLEERNSELVQENEILRRKVTRFERYLHENPGTKIGFEAYGRAIDP